MTAERSFAADLLLVVVVNLVVVGALIFVLNFSEDRACDVAMVVATTPNQFAELEKIGCKPK